MSVREIYYLNLKLADLRAHVEQRITLLTKLKELDTRGVVMDRLHELEMVRELLEKQR